FLGGRPDRPSVPRLHATALVVGTAVSAAALLAAVPLRTLLHLPGGAGVAWLGAMLLPHTLLQGYQGLLQGAGRHGRLAAVTVGLGVAQLAGGRGRAAVRPVGTQ